MKFIRKYGQIFLGAFVFVAAAMQLAAPVAAAVPVSDGVNVDDRLQVKLGGLRFNRLNGTFDTLARVTNTSSFPVFGPIGIVVTNLQPAVASLDNADGVDTLGRPFKSVPLTGDMLARGKSVADIPLQFRFTAPSPVPLSFDLEMQGVPVVLLTPGSKPFSLQSATQTEVTFTVQSQGMDPKASKPVALVADSDNIVMRDPGTGAELTSVALNDAGRDGDQTANDGLFSGRVLVDTATNGPGAELVFRAQVDLGGELQSSPPHSITVTNLPTDLVASNLSVENLLDDGQGVALVGNELLIWFKPGVPENGTPAGDTTPGVIGVDDVVTALVALLRNLKDDASIVGDVVGTNLRSRLYQVAFNKPDVTQEGLVPVVLTVNDMEGMIGWLLDSYFDQVEGASANPVGTLATASTCASDGDVALSTDNLDPNLPAVEQEALWRINVPAAWDIATGQGVTVTVLDSGADLDHESLVNSLTPQSVDDTLVGNNFEGHGTGVAAIVGARKLPDASGILGVAKDALVEALQMPSNNVGNSLVGNDTYSNGSDLISVLTNELNQNGGGILSLSMGGNWDIRSFVYGYAVTQICKNIEAIVWDKGDPENGIEPHARAIMLAAAGNGSSNNYFYPAQCNEVVTNPSDPKFNLAAQLIHKELLLAVASTRTDSDLLYEDTACGSNYGSWIDVLAPGNAVLTAKVNGGYERRTGTSYATPMVAGAAALLRQRGVNFDDIQEHLVSSAVPTEVNGDGGPMPGPDPRVCDSTMTHCAGRIDVHAALLAANAATPPICDIEIPGPNENITIEAGAQVYFKGTAIDPHGNDAMTYTWNFGAETDPAGSDKLVPGYVTFNNTTGAQTFIEVTMTATDAFGAQCTTEPRLIAVEAVVSYLNVADASTLEGDDLVFTVNRTGELLAGQTFDYTVSPGTALDGVDYSGASSGTLVFAAGESSKDVVIPTIENGVATGSRQLTLTLSAPTSGLAIDTGSAVGTIEEDDVVSFVVDDRSRLEGNGGAINFLFTVSRTVDAPGATLSVDYATADGTAQAGVDYTGDSGSLSFGPGVMARTVVIVVNGDQLFEDDETFDLQLSNAVVVLPNAGGGPPAANVAIGDATGLGTIRNDDSAPVLSLSNAPVPAATEGGAAIVRVLRSGDAQATQSVELQAFADPVAGDTASIADLDPAAASTTVVFQSGDSFVDVAVPTADDADEEPTETFSVLLAGVPSIGSIDPAGQRITAIILDDERLAGDVNGNGVLDAGDLLLATRIVYGSYVPSADELARLDIAPAPVPDGQITVADLHALARLITGTP